MTDTQKNEELINFCEKYLNIKLTDWQKYFVTQAYTAHHDCKWLYCIPPRRINKQVLSVLQALAIIKSDMDSKKENNNV